MKLRKRSDRVWMTSYEEERDRPAIGYIRGDRYCLAVDAGHSREHVEEFYALLAKEKLPLPDFTVLTHWHWDHTFGMHAIHGVSLAEGRTEAQLQRLREGWREGTEEEMKAMDCHIAREYQGQRMCVVGADMVFQEEILLDLGGIHARCFHTEAPHTEDSVLILLPEEGFLFFGDCISGEYPEWIADPARMERLIQTLEGLDFNLAIGGHWEPFKKRKLLERLKS